MTKTEAVVMASTLQSLRPDKWVQFGIAAFGKGENDYGVERVRFCFVELVAR